MNNENNLKELNVNMTPDTLTALLEGSLQHRKDKDKLDFYLITNEKLNLKDDSGKQGINNE